VPSDGGGSEGLVAAGVDSEGGGTVGTEPEVDGPSDGTGSEGSGSEGSDSEGSGSEGSGSRPAGEAGVEAGVEGLSHDHGGPLYGPWGADGVSPFDGANGAGLPLPSAMVSPEDDTADPAGPGVASTSASG
jgi:hypothetical protein